MNKEELLKDLKAVPEMVPDDHDGSYELIREIVASYKTMGDYSHCNFRDLNAIYMMAIGTWKLNAEKKKDYVKQGHLSDNEKNRIDQVIDRIWDNACNSKYQNREQNKPSIGMFGTGFYSFQNKTTDECVQSFIKMLVDIADMQNDNEMFDRAAKVLNDDFKGMGAASASVVLHCLKPNTFPILNGNMGAGNIFGTLGVNLKRPAEIGTYIENCRQIKEFRDANLTIKNYRILDLWVGKLDMYQDDDYTPSLKEYDPGISRERYEQLLTDENVIKKSSLDVLYYIYKMSGEASCKDVSDKYGNSPQHYNSNATYIARCIYEVTGCPLYKGEDESGKYYWSILFQGRYAKKDENGVFIWHMRKPLLDAMETIDVDGFFEEFENMASIKNTNEFELNTILFGPPGTGKTYNTVLNAVSICEPELNVYEMDYADVLAKYNEFKKEGRIEFTTFHQSYGYEEFIEGIKPVMSSVNGESKSKDVQYDVIPGVFKTFCENARKVTITSEGASVEKTNPKVWCLMLDGTGESKLKSHCFANSEIRIGWPKLPERITYETEIDTEFTRSMLTYFQDEMEIGDIVVIQKILDRIDAIGIVTGEYEYDPQSFDEEWPRKRSVKWMATGIDESLYELNGGKHLGRPTIYPLNRVKADDIIKIANKYSAAEKVFVEQETKPYVFIIDEINRGNISKIFGELITLIEVTKRDGEKEAMETTLPYSGDLFSVPNNVYILGTMNTADRSIALMDTALRRRFAFVEMMPEPQILRNIGADKVEFNGQVLDVAAMLELINKRIEYLYDREHTIGHAFFTGLKNNPSIDKLASIFEKSVIPLLQEYFYEDYGKIQMVLGDDGKQKEEDKQYQFIRDTEVKPAELFNTVPDFESQTKKYEIQKSAFYKIESYKKIGKGL